MRRFIRLGRVVTFLAIGLATALAAQAMSGGVAFDITAGAGPTTLKQFAAQAHLQLLFDYRAVQKLRTPAIKGQLTPTEALKEMLEGTGFAFHQVNEHTIAITGPSAAMSSAGMQQDAPADAVTGRQANSTFPGLLLAQVTSGQTGGATAVDQQPAQSSERVKLQEVVVTARKRSENAQNVPISLSVLGADDIQGRLLVNDADYLRGMPGVNQVDSGSWFGQAIIIRGIASTLEGQGFTGGSTVSTYFGETPTTDTAGLDGSMIDLKLVDIERVEVLRGPQGTAFGGASLGGAVRTIPVAPRLDEFDVKLTGGYSATAGFGGGNDTFQGVLNMPLVDGRLAIRAVAYEFMNSGYYRNVAGSDAAYQAQVVAPFGAQSSAVNVTRVGDTNVEGARVAALLQATDDLKFTVAYLTQQSQTNGWALQDAATPYTQTLFQVAPQLVSHGQLGGGQNTAINIANAVGEYELGWGGLVGTYSYIRSGNNNVLDFDSLGSLWPVSFDTGPLLSHLEQSAEFRLVTKLQGSWNFVSGLYFDKQHQDESRAYYWTGTPASNFFDPGQTNMGGYFNPRNLKQEAAFGEATWEFLPGWTLLGGIRGYHYERTDLTIYDHLFGPLSSNTFTTSNASGTVGRASLSYQPNPDALLYALWSQGFRLGKPQPPLALGAPGSPCNPLGYPPGVIPGTDITIASTGIVNSDSVNNYELGSKFTLLNNRMTLDANVFLVQWKGIPLTVYPLGNDTALPSSCRGEGWTTNAGNARSVGVELQSKYQITDAFRLELGGSWTHAYLTEVLDNAALTGISVGDRLPGGPEVNGQLSAQYAFKLGGHASALRTDAVYVGSFNGNLADSATRVGGYGLINVTWRIGLDKLDVDLYARNVANRDSWTFRGSAGVPGTEFGYRAQPRTIGLQLVYPF